MGEAIQDFILVVDPEEVTRRHLCDFLVRLGFGVDSADTYEEALTCFSRRTYAVAVLDDGVNKPGQRSLLVRMQEMTTHTSAIVMSTSPSIKSIIASLRQGAVDYIIKPYEIQDLAFIVPRVVERSRMNATRLAWTGGSDESPGNTVGKNSPAGKDKNLTPAN